MQCNTAAGRTLCTAKNAYNPSLALRCAFATQQKPVDSPSPQLSQSSIGRWAAFDIRRARPRWIDANYRTESSDGWQDFMGAVREQKIREERKKKEDPHYVASQRKKEWFDYRGGNIIWPIKASNEEPSRPPWMLDKSQMGRLNGHQILTKEIEAFVKWLEPTENEKAARQAAVEDVQAALKKCHGPGNIGFELFGSQTTGLALPFSDIDFRAWDKNLVMQRKKNFTMPAVVFKRFDALRTGLTADNRFLNVRLRNTGYHPIINFQHKESGLDIQIVASAPVYGQHQATGMLLANIPNLRELFIVVRTFLDMRGLCDTFTGGIGSYGILIMLAASILRHHSHPWYNTLSGCQLQRFLAFYRNLPLTERGVRVASNPFFKKHDHSENLEVRKHIEAAKKRRDIVRAGRWAISVRNELQPYLLCLQDPADPANDLGKRTNAIKHIQQTISFFKDVLRDKVIAATKSQRFRDQENSILLPLVGDCHEVYAARREKIEEYGKWVAEGGREEEKKRKQLVQAKREKRFGQMVREMRDRELAKKDGKWKRFDLERDEVLKEGEASSTLEASDDKADAVVGDVRSAELEESEAEALKTEQAFSAFEEVDEPQGTQVADESEQRQALENAEDKVKKERQKIDADAT